ncbi:MAG TPA: peptidylprolyl isomerase [Verrucomicrobiae bacterium]|nr:peptidylprolyl isomerase [Verrucomicrobiae bacterium]
MRRQFAVLTVAMLVIACASPAAEIVDGVAAIVNDKIITYSEVRSFVQPVAQQLRRNFSGQDLVDQVRKAEMDALNQLIERALIIQEFKEKGYKIPETVIEQQINDIISNDYGGNRAAFVKTLEAENLTLSQYRDQVRERVIIQAMRGHKTQQAVVVSPHKMEKYYSENLDQYKVGEQIKLRMIFIKRGEPVPSASLAEPVPPAPTNELLQTTSETNNAATNLQATAITLTTAVSLATMVVTNAADALVTNAATTASASETNTSVIAREPATPAPVDLQRKLAEEILAKLDAGDSFESMARVYSEGKEAKEGGDWGWIGKDVLRKELNEIAFSLKAGQHSRLIETAEGYYILQVEDVKPAHTVALAEVRDDIEKILLQQQRARMQEDWVKDLRAKAYIHLF